MVYVKVGYLNHKRTCLICKSEFMGRKQQILCSDRCRDKRYGLKSEYTNGLPCGTVGAIQELRVSADLLLKGYEVFRALSPHCSCDLLVMKKDKMFRVEVKTGYQDFSGKVHHPSKNIRAEYLVIALKDKLIYRPELP